MIERWALAAAIAGFSLAIPAIWPIEQNALAQRNLLFHNEASRLPPQGGGPRSVRTRGPRPYRDPILAIDAGMHTAPINRISVDAECRLLASGSDDKTVKLWRLPDLRLLDTLRLPIGTGNEGKIYAVAISSDGSWFAA